MTKNLKLIVTTVDDELSHRQRIIDDCVTIQEEINAIYEPKGVKIQIDTLQFEAIEPFLDFLKKESETIHVLVIDLKFGERPTDRKGWEGVAAVLPLEIIPVIIYSAYVDEEIKDQYKTVFIAKSSKGDATILNVLKKMILIKLRLMLEKERILGEFHNLSLETLRDLFDETALESISEKVLSEIAINRLKSVLLNKPLLEENNFSPESIFLSPPLNISENPNSLMLGDIIKFRDSNKYFIVISPSCDLVHTHTRSCKIQNVLVLPCYLKSEEVPLLKGFTTAQKDGKITDFIRGGSMRVQKCPKKIFSVDYILLSFKDYITYSYPELIALMTSEKISKVSTISTPYIESIQNLFIRDFSRIGTPDTLDVDSDIANGKKFIGQS